MFLKQAWGDFVFVAQNDPIVSWITSLSGHQFQGITALSVVIRLLCALLLGTIVGAERATKGHAAGLRTYILVSLGACVAMLTNDFLGGNADEARIGAAVITGIGFIGAGSIMITPRNHVRGLTTAAGLWACACASLAFGAGFYTLGLCATLLIVVAVAFMPRIESYIQANARSFNVHVELLSRPDLKKLLDLLRSKGVAIKSIAYDPAYANTGLSVYSLALFIEKSDQKMKKADVKKMIEELEYVNYCETLDQ